MRWTKKGLLIEPRGQFDWMTTHAALPHAERVGAHVYRVYFYGRDNRNRARIGHAEIAISESPENLGITEKPVLDLGPVGAFDDSGVMPSWIVDHGCVKYLFYTGWSQGVTVPYYFYIGLATSRDDGKTFDRVSAAPILERDDHDPYLTASPCTLVEQGLWKMWYVSGVRREPQTCYHIKYAESDDGIHWSRAGVVCIDFQHEGETRIARPCVIKEGGGYKMWYCYAVGAGGYRLGYAESGDGIDWERKDEEAGIDVSEAGWDSEMVCYPFVFDHDGKRYMLYNGNGYGKTGFGYAILEEE